MAKLLENKLKGSYKNIMSLPMTLDNVSAGETWYTDAHKVAETVGHLAMLYGIYLGTDMIKVGAGVLSALSPQTDWDSNIQKALLLVTEGTRKQTTVQHNKALAILAGSDPERVLGNKARKTQAFYKAILEPYNDYSPPVIDRHAVAVYMGRNVTDGELRLLDSLAVYNKIEKAYMKASQELGINHHKLQAQTWCQWRQNKGITSRLSGQLAIE